MKKTFVFITAIAFAMAVIGCDSSAKKVENAQTDVAEAKADLKEAKDDYTQEIEAYRQETAEKIATNDKSITDFKARIATEKKEAKADYNKKIVALEKKNSDLKKRMDDYKETSKENWLTFKTEFNRDMDELGQAFKDLTVKNVK